MSLPKPIRRFVFFVSKPLTAIIKVKAKTRIDTGTSLPPSSAVILANGLPTTAHTVVVALTPTLRIPTKAPQIMPESPKSKPAKVVDSNLKLERKPLSSASLDMSLQRYAGSTHSDV